MTYLEESTKYFAPLDEIAEALINHEGICGLGYPELLMVVKMRDEFVLDVLLTQDLDVNLLPTK